MSLLKDFDEVTRKIPETDFFAYLSEIFDRETAVKVVAVFEKMELPVPQGRQEFLEGYEGGLVFLNRYGLVIRIEGAETRQGHIRSDRINDSPWILQPLASIDAGKAIIEIIPGCHFDDNAADVSYLYDALLKQGHAFWDAILPNVGRMPVKTVFFPEGIPIVIDRLAVQRLTDSMKDLRQTLMNVNDNEDREAAEAQQRLYAPLRKAFDEGWSDGSKMSRFWALCQECVKEGQLVAGWNEFDHSRFSAFKTSAAIEIAKQYEERLKPNASATPQSLHPPA